MIKKLKYYFSTGFDKLFYLFISFKVISFYSIILISTWLCYIEKISGSNLAAIWTVLISTVLVAREYAKKNFKESIEKIIDNE